VALLRGLGASGSAASGHSLRRLRHQKRAIGGPVGILSGSAGASLPAQAALAIIADQCKCRFVAECTCPGAVAFMDCVADACASGECKCSAMHFRASCSSMSTACPNAGLHCVADQATCVHDPTGPTSNEAAEILAELESLKARKCKLKKAFEDGFVNASNRLRELEAKIQGRLDALHVFQEKTPKKAAPYMGCAAEGVGANLTTSWIGEAVPMTVVDREREATKAQEATASARAAPALAPRWSGMSKRFWVMFSSWIVYIVALLLAAFLYSRVRLKMHFPQDKSANNGTGFTYGLLSCHKDWKLAVLSFCCPPLRWADTMDKANDTGGLLRYWQGIAILVTLWALYMFVAGVCLYPFTASIFVFGILLLEVEMRQRLRRRYDISAGSLKTYAEDCLAWICCSCCAMVQEARQVEAMRSFSAAGWEAAHERG